MTPAATRMEDAMQERDPDAMRNAFHAEMRKRGLPVTRIPGGDYKWHSAAHAFGWWQAAWEAATKPSSFRTQAEAVQALAHVTAPAASAPSEGAKPRPFAEVFQVNQGRYFTCLAAVGVDTPPVGTKVYLAPTAPASESAQGDRG